MPEQNGLIPLRVEDFSGGLTDYPLGGDPDQYEKADNVFINDNKDLQTRPGRLVKYDSRVDSTYNLSEIANHNGEILMQCGPKVKVNVSGISTIRGISSHDVFYVGDDASQSDFAYWREHTVATNDQFASIQKIFKDENSSWRTENLGLPEVTYSGSILLANDLKAKLNAHMADGTEHSTPDSMNTISAPNADDVDSLITLTSALLSAYDAHEGDAELGSAWAYHSAQEASDHSLTSLEEPVSLFECYQRLKDLKAKFNAHDADSTAHASGSGAHQSSLNIDPQISESGTGSNYLYGFHFLERYYVEDRQFIERGRLQLFSVEDIDAPNVTTVNLTNLPVLDSGSKENWNTDLIKLAVFRTTSDGSVLYFLGEVANGTTTLSDSMSDDDLVNQETAYTEGGVLDNDQMPKAKFVEIVNDTLVLGHVKVGSQVYKNRGLFSKPGEISGVNLDNYVDFEDEIRGLGRASTYPIFLLKDRCYRVEGQQNSSGVGTATKRSISDRVGTVSPKSVVNTEKGVFFAGEDGFYFTDGFQLNLISTDRETSFKALFNKENIRGAYDKKNNRILFAVQQKESSTSNDTVWVGHLKYTTRKGGAPFTTWSGGLDPDNFTASALRYVDGNIYLGDERGYLLYFDEDTKTDVFVNTTKLPTAWDTQTIHYDYRSISSDLGDAQCRKWVPKININCDNVTSLNMRVESNNDNSGYFNQLKPIQNNGVVLWKDRSILWKEGGVLWNYSPIISEWRYFPASNIAGLRCMYKQIKLSNNFILIDDSDGIGGATADEGAKTITLESYPTADWVDDAVNYYISFDTDEYSAQFLIINNESGVLTVADSNDDLIGASGASWKIYGYKKNEVLKMMNYVVSYRPLTMSQKTYSPEAAS